MNMFIYPWSFCSSATFVAAFYATVIFVFDDQFLNSLPSGKILVQPLPPRYSILLPYQGHYVLVQVLHESFNLSPEAYRPR